MDIKDRLQIRIACSPSAQTLHPERKHEAQQAAPNFSLSVPSTDSKDTGSRIGYYVYQNQFEAKVTSAVVCSLSLACVAPLNNSASFPN